MKTTLSKPLVLLASLLCTVAIAQAQEPTPPELPVLPPPVLGGTAAGAVHRHLPCPVQGQGSRRCDHARHPYRGDQWRVDMQVVGRRGFASVLGLNIEQSTVFEKHGATYAAEPLPCARACSPGKKVTGTYDWKAGTAQWVGDLKRSAPSRFRCSRATRARCC